jgi:pilus assembly protein CpaE
MSSQVIKALFALDDDVETSSFEHALVGGPTLQIVGIVSGLDDSWRSLEETSPDLLVLVVRHVSEKALYLIEAASKQQPDRPIVVLYEGNANGFMQRAFEAGADDLLTLPETPERVRFALEKAVARKRGSGATAGQAPMICLLGPKGGTGKTVTACNLSVALALAGRKPVLVDLDLQFGDVGIALGLSPERTVYDLVRAGGSLDVEKVETFLTSHSSGLRVLLAPTRPDQAGLIDVDFVRNLLRTVRSCSDVVLIDTPPAFSPEVIAAIDAASHLCVVGALDALSLKDSRLGLETLEMMGHSGAKMKFVLNRADGGGGISRRDVEGVLGRVPDTFVPEEREITRGIAEGKPIVLLNERSGATHAFKDLAKAYVQEFEAAAQAASPNANGKSRRGFGDLVLGRRR